jgi:predicted ATPase
MQPINVLIGANGSGKSNFISVFRLLENIYNQRLQSYIKQNGGSERFFYFGSKTTKEIIIDVVLADNENSNNGYFLRLKKNTDADALFVDYDQASFHNKIDHPKQPYTKEITNSKDESSMKHNVQRIVEYSKTFLRQCKLYHFHDTSSAAGFKSFQDIGKNKFLDSFATNLAPFLYRLKTDFSSDYQNIVSAVQTVAPYFQDFDFNIEGENILLRWQHVNDLSNLGFSAQTLSDGTARFIASCLSLPNLSNLDSPSS